MNLNLFHVFTFSLLFLRAKIKLDNVFVDRHDLRLKFLSFF